MEKQKVLSLLKSDPKKANFDTLANNINIMAKPKKDAFRIVYYNYSKKSYYSQNYIKLKKYHSWKN